jgi:hypothetical protein
MKFNFLKLLKTIAPRILLFCLVIGATTSHAQFIGVERGTSNVVEIATNTGSVTTLFNLPFTADFDVGMDYNPADGFLYLTHVNAGNLDFYRLNLVANTATYVKTINGVGLGSSSIGFTTNGNVYVYSDPSGNGSGTLYFVTWATGNVQSLGSSGTPAMLGGDYDSTRNVFWASDESSGKVYQLSVANGSILWTSTSTWSSGNASSDYLGAVNISPNGDILVSATDNSGSEVRILKVNPSTGQWTTNLTTSVNGSLRFANFPPPPALGITTYGNQPVVILPASVGNNYTLQMTTNLSSGNWVTVSNGIPFTGVQIPNSPSPAFFRLQ